MLGTKLHVFQIVFRTQPNLTVVLCEALADTKTYNCQIQNCTNLYKLNTTLQYFPGKLDFPLRDVLDSTASPPRRSNDGTPGHGMTLHAALLLHARTVLAARRPELLRTARELNSRAIFENDWLADIWHRFMHHRAIAVALDIRSETLLVIATPTDRADL